MRWERPLFLTKDRSGVRGDVSRNNRRNAAETQQRSHKRLAALTASHSSLISSSAATVPRGVIAAGLNDPGHCIFHPGAAARLPFPSNCSAGSRPMVARRTLLLLLTLLGMGEVLGRRHRDAAHDARADGRQQGHKPHTTRAQIGQQEEHTPREHRANYS